MEAELERQAGSFHIERERLTALVRVEEDYRIENENAFKQLRTEVGPEIYSIPSSDTELTVKIRILIFLCLPFFP